MSRELEYEILSVMPYHKDNGGYIGTVVVIKTSNDEIYIGKGKSDREAKNNASQQIENADVKEALAIVNTFRNAKSYLDVSYHKTCWYDDCSKLDNYILNSQQQSKELERYKKFVNSIEINEKHNLTILNETELEYLKEK
jgi:hypothetical protein